MPTKELIGHIKKIKTGPPYPLTRPNGDIWLCKWRFEYYENEPDGEIEEYIYIAYPTQNTKGVDVANCCKRNLVDQALWINVDYNEKSPNRGVVLEYRIIDEEKMK